MNPFQRKSFARQDQCKCSNGSIEISTAKRNLNRIYDKRCTNFSHCRWRNAGYPPDARLTIIISGVNSVRERERERCTTRKSDKRSGNELQNSTVKSRLYATVQLPPLLGLVFMSTTLDCTICIFYLFRSTSPSLSLLVAVGFTFFLMFLSSSFFSLSLSVCALWIMGVWS